MGEISQKAKALAVAVWAQTSRRVRVTGGITLFLAITVALTHSLGVQPPVPRVSLTYQKDTSPYDPTKVALLIENRPNPILAPLLLHFMSVVPPDWRFRFMGSEESVAHVNGSTAIREQVSVGKLDLTYIPANMSTAGQEMISRFLTNLWLYETVLAPAEHLLIFQTDSILCANAGRSLNEFLDYDWLGAPWNPHGRWGGNGGLSLRRVSTIVDVLRHQVRTDRTEPEDVWLAERLSHRPGCKVANGTVSSLFSGEMHGGDVVAVLPDEEAGRRYGGSVMAAAEAGEYVQSIDGWRDGFYEPMGFHTGGSGSMLHGAIWGTPEKRKHMWEYCPEVKMTLVMDAAQFVPGNCKANWKRDLGGTENDLAAPDGGNEQYPYGTEMIHGQEYPILPPNLVPF